MENPLTDALNGPLDTPYHGKNRQIRVRTPIPTTMLIGRVKFLHVELGHWLPLGLSALINITWGESVHAIPTRLERGPPR